VPVVYLQTACEISVNFGQSPFAFSTVAPVSGWCLYSEMPLEDARIETGMANSHHLLHYFEASPHGENLVDLLQTCPAKPLADGGCYEVTCFYPNCRTVIGIGLTGEPIEPGFMVGWGPGSIGVHTDDGCIFRGDGEGGPNVCAKGELVHGETIGLRYDTHAIEVFRWGKWFPVVGDWNGPAVPAFSVQDYAVIVVNFGEFPFTGESTGEAGKVRLFNGVCVEPTNNNLSKIGIAPGDLVEARDLSFRGTFVGEYNGYFLVSIPGIDGAVALDVISPLFVRRLLRVISSPNPHLATCLLHDTCTIFGIAASALIYCTQFGFAMLLGQSDVGYVMRPILDLMNNSACFVVPEMPCPLAEYFHEIPPRPSGFEVFDIWEDPKGSLMLILDHKQGDRMAWKEGELVAVNALGNLSYRFFGFGYRYVDDGARAILVNGGCRRGGIGYGVNQHWTMGNSVVSSRLSLRGSGAHAVGLVPGPVEFLLQRSSAAMMSPARASQEDSTVISVPGDWFYESDGHELLTTIRPLILDVTV
jgi:hypothetical protein